MIGNEKRKNRRINTSTSRDSPQAQRDEFHHRDGTWSGQGEGTERNAVETENRP